MADEKPLEEQQKEKQGRWYYKVSRVRKPFEEKPLEEQQKKAKPFEEQPTTEEPLEDDQQQEERELLSVCVCVLNSGLWLNLLLRILTILFCLFFSVRSSLSYSPNLAC